MPQSAHFDGLPVPFMVLRRLVESSEVGMLFSGSKEPEAVLMLRCVAWYPKVCLQMQSIEISHICNDCSAANVLSSTALKTAPAAKEASPVHGGKASNGCCIYLDISLALLAEACRHNTLV